MRLAAHLLKVAWEYVRDYVWSKWKDFLDANAYEKGKVIGKLVFEIVATIIPFTKLGKIGQLAGRLAKIEFINRLLSRISRSRLAKHPKLVENLVNEGNALLRCLLLMCFAEGTLVWTRDGLKSVEQIKVGDWVLSKDPRLGKQEYRKVIATIKSNAMQLCKLRYRIFMPQKTPIKAKLRQPAKTIAHGNSKDGEESEEEDSESEEDEIECTKEHLFWVVNRQGFVPAGSLTVGDRLLLASGQEAVIVAISQKAVKSGQSFITYNLEVEDFHTYFVGKKGVLVHNGCYEDHCELIKNIRQAFKAAGWELSKRRNVGIAKIYREGKQIGKNLVGISGMKNIREEAVIRKKLLDAEVLKYDENIVNKLAEALEVTLDPRAKSDSEVKIIAHILQSVEHIDEILIVSEKMPCGFCDRLLQGFVNKHPWIRLRVRWFYTLTEDGWKEIPDERIYSPKR